jgi:hypothetical protein
MFVTLPSRTWPEQGRKRENKGKRNDVSGQTEVRAGKSRREWCVLCIGEASAVT